MANLSLKVLDRLILREFVGPCLLSFFIVQFVLIMQKLWLLMDKIMGKGYGMDDFLYLIWNFSLSEIPKALPLTILLSSVMVYGGMAERYELYSAKSSGLSFFRLLRPGLYAAIAVALLSFFASNVLRPNAKRAFHTKLKDMRTNQLTFAFDEKVFSHEFKNFSIRIGKKYEDGRRVDDVMIYNHLDPDKSVLNMLRAKRGEMYTTPDGKFLIMDLYDGYQVTEQRKQATDRSQRNYNTYARPMLRAQFSKLRKIFQLSDVLDLDIVNVEYRKFEMLNSAELLTEIDTMQEQRSELIKKLDRDFLILESVDKDTTTLVKPESENQARIKSRISSTKAKVAISKQIPEFKEGATSYNSLLESLDIPNMKAMSERLKRSNQSILTLIGNNEHDANLISSNIEKHQLYFHNMYAHALICILFLFIGAPAGAIIKKGGFGYPLLIAIVFYMVFIMTDIGGTKLVSSNAIKGYLGAWGSVLILSPFALYLTWRALRDNRPIVKPILQKLRLPRFRYRGD